MNKKPTDPSPPSTSSREDPGEPTPSTFLDKASKIAPRLFPFLFLGAVALLFYWSYRSQEEDPVQRRGLVYLSQVGHDLSEYYKCKKRGPPPPICADLLSAIRSVVPLHIHDDYAIFLRPDCAINPRRQAIDFWSVFPIGGRELPRVEAKKFLIYAIGPGGKHKGRWDVWSFNSEGKVIHVSDPSDRRYSTNVFR